MNNSLLFIVLVLYAFASVGFFVALLRKQTQAAKRATLIMVAALIVQIGAFALYHSQGISSATFGTRELAISLSIIVAGTFIAFQPFTKTRLLGAFVSPAAMSLSAAALFAEHSSSQITSGSGVLAFHIAFTIAGEALFIVAALAGALFLIQETLIRKKLASVFIRLLPPLDDLDRINRYSLLIGFPFLTLGLIIGIGYTNHFGNQLNVYDAKSIWATLMWICYALILYQRRLSGWRGNKIAKLSLSAACLLLILFFLALKCPASWHRFI